LCAAFGFRPWCFAFRISESGVRLSDLCRAISGTSDARPICDSAFLSPNCASSHEEATSHSQCNLPAICVVTSSVQSASSHAICVVTDWTEDVWVCVRVACKHPQSTSILSPACVRVACKLILKMLCFYSLLSPPTHLPSPLPPARSPPPPPTPSAPLPPCPLPSLRGFGAGLCKCVQGVAAYNS
jgi:hypothetical protein